MERECPLLEAVKKPRLVVERNWREKLNELNIWWCLPLVFALGMNVWMLIEVRSFRKWLEREDDEWTQL